MLPGRGQIRMGHDPASSSPCPALSLGKCRWMSSHSGQIARYNQSQRQPIPQGCLLIACLPKAESALLECELMTKRSKVTELLEPPVLSVWIYPSCWMLPAGRAPSPGMALQLCNGVALQARLLALLKAAEALTGQDSNSQTLSLR